MRASVFIAVPAFAAAVFAQSVRLESRLQLLSTHRTESLCVPPAAITI